MGIPGTAGIGLPSLQQVGDFSAGFGDAVTLGGTNWVREQLGVNDAVNKCSAAFGWGGYAGQAASLVPIAGGARLAAAGTVRAAPILKESGSRT